MASAAGKRTRSRSNVSLEATEDVEVKTTSKKSRKSTGKASTSHIHQLQDLQKALESSSAADALTSMKDGQLIEARTDQSVYEVFGILSSNKILSVPLYDVNTKQYIGFVDMVDLVTVTVDIVESVAKDTTAKDQSPDMEDLEEFQEKLTIDSMSARLALDLSRRDPFEKVYTDENMFEVAKKLVECHHVAVFDKENKMVGIITQSGLVEYITEEHATLYTKLMNKLPLKEIPLPSQVHTILDTKTPLEAFHLMKDKKISGVGIVDKDGKLKDVISVRDLMLWTEWIAAGATFRFSNLTALHGNMNDFLTNSRAQREVEKRAKPVECKMDRMVSDLIGDMLVQNIHRMVVVNDAEEPISIVTFGDILRALLMAH